MLTSIPCRNCGKKMVADMCNNIWCDNEACTEHDRIYDSAVMHAEYAKSPRGKQEIKPETPVVLLKEQEQLAKEIGKIFTIFTGSESAIRPHFILTGPSGTGKSHVVKALAEENEAGYFEINAAQLTKEGTAGNSLSKALAPLREAQGKPVICFVDEFDKLFISGNANSELAHETTNGVQNEFLKVLESEYTSVFADYGKYAEVQVDNVLFVFAGAFNGEKDISLDRLREMGIKTEFLGRVGLVFNTQALSKESLLQIVQNSSLLDNYVELFAQQDNRSEIIETISEFILDNYEANTLGVRMVNTLIHRYFIKGGKLAEPEVKQATFQRILKLD